MVRYKSNITGIIVIPNPILRQKSKNLKKSEIGKKEFLELIKDMTYLMDKYNGIGLSAVQVGVLKNLFIIKKDLESKEINIKNYLNEIEVYINPKILEYSVEVQEGWEGCLSIPNIECLVQRSQKIKVKYLDLEGKTVEKEINGFRAVVFQHEYDHTQGILILDRAKEIREVGD